MTARKRLLHDGVSGKAALGVHLFSQNSGIPNHGRKAVFGKGLPHLHCRLQHQDRSRVIVDVVPQNIQQHFRLAHLRGGFEHHHANMGIADSVHDLALVWCIVGVPSPCACAGLRGHLPKPVRPLTDCQLRRRFQLLQNPCEHFHHRRVHIDHLPLLFAHL